MPRDTPSKMAVALRDRVVALRRVKSSELCDNTGNWRKHPKAQQDALGGILSEVGVAGALLAYNSARNGGRLTLIDGHLRKDARPDTEWPTLVLDVNDAEADMLLAVYDPIAALAQADKDKLGTLLQSTLSGDAALQAFLSQLAVDHGITPPEFAPVGADAQPRLDERAAVTCPECGTEFHPK